MAQFRVDIQVTPDQLNGVILQMMQAIQVDVLADWLQEDIDPYLRARVEARFNQEGDDVVGAWLPLRASTERIRVAKGYPPSSPINVRSGQMRHFLTAVRGDVKQSGIQAELVFPGPVGDPLTEQKIRVAQQGKTAPVTPPRPVLGLNENDLFYIQTDLVRHMFAGLRATP